MTAKEIATQIGRTALLCGGLGAALYLVLSHAVHYPLFAPMLAFALAAALVLLVAGSLRYALREGIVPAKVRSISRQDEPVIYWSVLAFEAACGCLSLAVAITALLRMLGQPSTD
jgi:hypothetical protein